MKACKRARSEAAKSAHVPPSHDYAGYTLAPDQGVDSVRYSNLSPAVFFENYVAPRRPVVMDGCLSESEGWRAGMWTNDYLRVKAGDAEVKVEWRAGAGGRFGQGQEKAMRFGDFLRELEGKSDRYYLTTQELGVDHSGRPQLMSAPLDKLQDDFPLRPKLAGALVPQNVNLWMGYTAKGGSSSSGLHHDFHDNLYILLRGKKTFRLFSPADAHRMYVEGDLVKVHPNGRLNYRGKETLGDGSDTLAETAARAAELVEHAAMKAEEMVSDITRAGASGGAAVVASGAHDSGSDASGGAGGGRVEGGDRLAVDSRKSEDEVAAAQAAVERGEIGAAERLALAEEELERALEAVLDAECAGGGGFGAGDSDDDSSDSDGGPGFFDGVNDNPSEQEFAAIISGGSKGGRGNGNSSSSGSCCNVNGGRGDDGDGGDGGDGVARMGTAAAATAAAGSVSGDVSGDGSQGAVAAPPLEESNGHGSGEEAGTAGGGGGGQRAIIKRKLEPAATTGGRGGGEEEAGGGTGGRRGAAPSNFSKVDPSLPRAELAERFPLFLDAVECTVEVKAGQMLYLPAGWFHEVSSVAAEDGHMAFNYWFHPPDAASGDRVCDASAPYKSSFWQRDWEARQREECHKGDPSSS